MHDSSKPKPTIIQTTRPLPFDQLPWDDFERLCLLLLPRVGFENPQHYGAAGGERGRDIVAHRDGELWYVQCKRVKQCGPKVLLDEIEKVQGLMADELDLQPAGLLFIASCDVSATARDRASKRCKELGLACEIWGRTDLDACVQPHSDIARTFFGWYTRPPLGVPFQAPPLPAHFVPRPEVSDVLKTRLLADEAAAPGTLVVSAVHGLGGIGKTTLVADLVRDLAVQTRFPDGVLWTTLGQQPDVLSLLAGWIQALGDYDFYPTLVENASAHLRTLLHDKACLLVVDDAWQADHARAFLVGGERCRVLVTTRDATLARKVTARLYDLDMMTKPQALALFEARLGPLDGNREQAAALARELGYLPLALELAAAQVDAGYSWGELLGAFQPELADLKALDLDEATYRNESLRLSFRLSLERLSPDDQDAFAWLGVLSEDARINLAMAATLWDQPETEARRCLRRLRAKALLRSVGDDRYTVHDLLHDDAKLRLAERIPLAEAHAVILARYRQKVPDERWDKLPDDGYIHTHLTWHMEQAGQAEAIHVLLCLETETGRNAWYEAWGRLGQTAGCQRDVSRAWRLSEEEFSTQPSPLTIKRQCRYALITASLNSLAKNIPPALLAALVENGIWSPAQGLAHAQQVPNLEQRAMTLVGLVPHLPESLISKASEAVWAIEDEYWCAKALSELVSYMPEHERVQALEKALARASAETLIDLAPSLPAMLLRQAIAMARELGWDPMGRSLRGKVLAKLVPRLALLARPQEALAAAREIDDKRWRTEALAGLAPYLQEPQREEILQEALAAALTVESEWEQAAALRALAPHLPEELLREVLAIARAMGGWERAHALARLLPRLAELGHPHEAMTKAWALEDEWHENGSFSTDKFPRAEALFGLAPYLPDLQRAEVLQESLTAVRAIESKSARANVLRRMIPHLPKVLLREVLAEVWAIGNASLQSGLLKVLYPHLPKALYRESLAAARAIDAEDCRAEALAELAPYLPEAERVQVLREALIAARAFEWRRAEMLVRVAPHLSEAERAEVLQEALAAKQAVLDRDAQEGVLAGLVPRLLALSCREEALRTARAIESKSRRVEALVTVGPHLPEPQKSEVLQEALATAQAMGGEIRQAKAPGTLRVLGDERRWVEALVRVAPHLPEPQRGEVLQEALEAARAVVPKRAEALVGLAAHLPEPQRRAVLQEALGAARAVVSKRAEELVGLASHLPEPQRGEVLQEALEGVRGKLDTSGRVQRLAELASHLPKPLGCSVLREALAAARAITVESWRRDALTRLAVHLAEPQRGEVLQEALAMAMVIDDGYRQALALADLAPHLSESSLRKAMATAQAIQGKSERHMALARMARWQPEASFREALAALRTVDSEKPSSGRTSHSPELLLGEALEAARAIGSKIRQVEALVELIPYMSDSQRHGVLRETLATACTIAGSRASVLTKVASHLAQLPCQNLYSLWQETLPALAARSREGLLADLHALESVITVLGGPEALSELVRAIQDVGRWWP